MGTPESPTPTPTVAAPECDAPAIDVAGQCIVITCNSAEQEDRLEVVLARPDTTFFSCGLCKEVLSCCLLCRTVGHYGTTVYWQRGFSFVLCTPCAKHLMTFDYDSRVDLLEAAVEGTLPLQDFLNGEHDNGPWRWDQDLAQDLAMGQVREALWGAESPPANE